MTEETPTPTSSPASDFQPEPEAASVPQPEAVSALEPVLAPEPEAASAAQPEPEPAPWPEPEAVAEPIVQAEAQPEPEPAPWPEPEAVVEPIVQAEPEAASAAQPEPEAATTAELPPPPEPEVEPASDEFAEALEEFERSAAPAAAASRAARGVKVGAKVKGKVVSVDEHQTLIDFGGRSEAVAEIGQFRNEDGTLRIAVGDVLDLFVVKTGEQVVLAASLRVDSHGALAKVREARAAGVPVNGKVVAVNSGGLAVNIGGVRAFCPMSQIELGFCADPSVYVGRTLEFLVTEMKEGRGGVVLSRRQVLRRVEGERAKVLLATLKVGDELEGTVTRLEAFGVFVDLGGIDGLVHVTELRHERTNHPKEVVHSGEKVHVRVLKLEPTKEGRPPRIALSIKAATPDPWTGVEARYPVGARVHGTVARLAEFGAFVSLEPGIDGLVHVSEVSAQRVAHPKEVLSPGQDVEAVVLSVDPVKRRLSLSIRETQSEFQPPARTPVPGEVVEGIIAGTQLYGVFVDLPEYGSRATGLLPREETGEPRSADLAQLYPTGQALKVEILEVRDNRIRLTLEGRPHPPQEHGSQGAQGAHAGRGRGGPSEGGGRDRGGSFGDRSFGDRPRGGRPSGPGRGPRSTGPGRGPRPEGRGPAGPVQTFTSTPQPGQEKPLTAMALALRKAMEEAKKKDPGDDAS